MDVSYIYFHELELNNEKSWLFKQKSRNKHDLIFASGRLFHNKYVLFPRH